MRHDLAVSLGVAVAMLLVPVTDSLEAQTTYRFSSVEQTGRAALDADSLFYPSGVAVDPTGVVWVADTANHVIRKLGSSGDLEIVAGSLGEEGHRDGSAPAARFSYPQGLTFDPVGNLYIADSGNGVVRRMGTDGRVETWAGRTDQRGTFDGERLEATFITPIALAWDLTGELWIADYSAHTIRKVGTDGDVETISGIPGTPGHADGDGKRSKFHYPSGIDFDTFGRLWVADLGSGTIRLVARDGFTETFAGIPGVNGHRDGSIEEAIFDHPADLVVRDDGVVFVADSWSHTVRRIDGEGVSTIAGVPTYPGDADGVGPAVRFDHPVAIALRQDGTLFVADMLNHALRQGTEEELGGGRRRAVGR